MSTPHPEDRWADFTTIRRLLWESKTWAFVGLGDDPTRTAYDQARLLQGRGKRIYPVHPTAQTTLGEPVYRTLSDIGAPIDVVGVYRRAAFAGDVVDEAIRVGAKAVWLPLDVIDEAAALRASEAGLDVVMNRCPAVEWSVRHRPPA
ncbi:CoA-binding protein [Actinocorallia sp. A-T 12471]|uniref:CoA-binding protein n=1 Tax=Actinocorallia sp. A-T 12471 TaxID=3089813 RepID=UPI0029D06484|nr:CoA-binding protein [Actinocorallia sp. A-T 12471]MDX6741298.1 CoA-binding protein [Actinocorallia sp. A-T 12471]